MPTMTPWRPCSVSSSLVRGATPQPGMLSRSGFDQSGTRLPYRSATSGARSRVTVSPDANGTIMNAPGLCRL